MLRVMALAVLMTVIGLSPKAEAHSEALAGRFFRATAGPEVRNYRNRRFDPATGRFLQRDPVLGGDPLYNPYCFPGNNPVTNADPMGTDAAILGSAGHLDIAVEVHDKDGKVIGWLVAGLFAQEYGVNNAPAGGTPAAPGPKAPDNRKQVGSSGAIVQSPGFINLTYYPEGTFRIKLERRIKGTVEQDRRLLKRVLDSIGKDQAWLDSLMDQANNKKTPGPVPARERGQGESEYWKLTFNCAHYVATGIDCYLGYDWQKELFVGIAPLTTSPLTPEILIERWDYRQSLINTERKLIALLEKQNPKQKYVVHWNRVLMPDMRVVEFTPEMVTRLEETVRQEEEERSKQPGQKEPSQSVKEGQPSQPSQERVPGGARRMEDVAKQLREAGYLE